MRFWPKSIIAALLAIPLFASPGLAFKVRVYAKPDGSIVVIVPNYRKMTEAQADDAFFERERQKQPGLAGAVRAMDVDHLSLPWAADPNVRKFRRDAHRWNGSQLIDDRKITTANEVAETLLWKEEEAIKKAPAARSSAEEKVMLRRPDLLTPAELKQMVSDWRGSGKAPGPSAFVPPADAENPPHPGRGR